MIGLAKKYEEIVVHKEKSFVTINDKKLLQLRGFRSDESNDFVRLDIPNNANIVKLLQRIRDESHRFAISYHSVLKTSRQTASMLDDVPGIGPITKRKLLIHFDSVSGLKLATETQIAEILGKKKAHKLMPYLKG